MFLLLSAVAANLIALPVLQTGTLEPSFNAELNQGRAAAVEVRLAVSPTGVPIHCSRGFVNGPPANAEAFCSMLQTRTRFAPARDAAGQPTYGVIYVWSHWSKGRWAGSDLPSWDPVDLALTINRMPKGFAEGSIFRLMLQADGDGKVGSCAVSTAGLTQQAIDMLCREAAKEPVTPATDERGTAVASVQEFVVRLTSQAFLDETMKRLRRK